MDVEIDEALLEARRRRSIARASAGLVAGPLPPGDMLRIPQVLKVREARSRRRRTRIRRSPRWSRRAGRGARRLERDARERRASTCATDLDAPARRAGRRCSRRPPRRRRAGQRSLRARLAERVTELRLDPPVDETPVAQEVVKFATRSEITRGESSGFAPTSTHWRGPGRRRRAVRPQARFLLQEMNREVNTIGSKAEGPRVRSWWSPPRPSSRRCGSRSRMSSDAPAQACCSSCPPLRDGKTTVVERLVQVVPDLTMSRSYTSRRGPGKRTG